MLHLFNFPRPRRHTYYFLRDAQQTAQVLITTSVDMKNVIAEREKYRNKGENVSYLAFLIKEISRVIGDYPQANSTLCDGWLPKIAQYEEVNAKFTLDKRSGSERIVASAVIPNSDKLNEQEIQTYIDEYKQADYDDSDKFHNLRRLNGLKMVLGRMLYKRLMSQPNKRLEIQGSFTITSLGHRDIELFYPISGNTLTFGIGKIVDKPIVIDGSVQVSPQLPLSLVFDHRIIDGAMAADILQEIKVNLEKHRS